MRFERNLSKAGKKCAVAMAEQVVVNFGRIGLSRSHGEC